MKRVFVSCDDARWSSRVPAGGLALALNHRTESPNVNLFIEAPGTPLLSTLESVQADLVRVAAYVYAADQSVSRGGKSDVFGEDWSRHFHLAVPVSDPDLWDSASATLSDCLSFVSADRWSFRFVAAARAKSDEALNLDPAESFSEPQSVVLFSSGLDSLCAAVEAMAAGKNPILVSHSPAFNVGNWQIGLVREMRRIWSDRWIFPRVRAAVHRDGTDAPETTQRTRSFLYAALGTAIADRLDIIDVQLADNGVVSLNLPINDQLVSTRASRSTHPRFIWLFNKLCERLFASPPRLQNPLWSRTRSEALEVLKSIGGSQLVDRTHSCSHVRYLTSEQNHCGTCSQCIDRRFATLAAGLEEYDQPGRYKTDILRGDLSGDSKTMAASYYGFALEVSDLDEEGLFARFKELYDAVIPNEPQQRQKSAEIAAMVRRHGRTLVSVMEGLVKEAAGDIARQRLPANSLICLVAGRSRQVELPMSSRSFSHSPHYEQCRLGENVFDRTPLQALIIRTLDEARSRGVSSLTHQRLIAELHAQGYSTHRVLDLFSDSPALGVLLLRPKKGHYALAG